jgi:hypothetical protein
MNLTNYEEEINYSAEIVAYNKTVKKTVGLITAVLVVLGLLIVWSVISSNTTDKRQDEVINGNTIVANDVAYLVVELEAINARMDTLENILLMSMASNSQATINNTVLKTVQDKVKKK